MVAIDVIRMSLRVPLRLTLELTFPLAQQVGVGVRVTSWDWRNGHSAASCVGHVKRIRPVSHGLDIPLLRACRRARKAVSTGWSRWPLRTKSSSPRRTEAPARQRADA